MDAEVEFLQVHLGLRERCCVDRCPNDYQRVGSRCLVGMLPEKEVTQQDSNPWNACAATGKHDLMDIVLLHVQILKEPVDGPQEALDVICTQGLELLPGDVAYVISAADDLLHFNTSLVVFREVSLGLFAGSPQAQHHI
mmetsp:Transcript_63728/g.151917  ORF Transcript_63728/g.151917 Transcript_63728/m.151917 type:complete len:139 (+) Transcript_63728:189-605(+)